MALFDPLDARELTVRKAASATGFAAANFSRIRNADLARFTSDRLMKMLGAPNDRVRVSVHVGQRPAGEVAVPSAR